MLLFDSIRVKALTLQATLPLRQDGISSRQKKHSKQSSVLSLYKNSATCKCYAPILLHTSFLNTNSVCTRVALLSLLYVPGPGALQRLLCRAPVFCAAILCSVVLRALWCTKCKSVVAPAARPGDRPRSSSGNFPRSFFCVGQHIF